MTTCFTSLLELLSSMLLLLCDNNVSLPITKYAPGRLAGIAGLLLLLLLLLMLINDRILCVPLCGTRVEPVLVRRSWKHQDWVGA